MNTIRLRLRRSFYGRQLILVLLFGGMGVVIASRHGALFKFAGIAPITLWALIMLREYFLGARLLDDRGATRRDGRRFEWTDLKQVLYVRRRLPSGQLGPLNNVDLKFTRGTVRILPLIVENAGDVLAFIKQQEGGAVVKS
jgi:hypothetical protein